ncbi:MAG: response regulator [Actinomycetota bacterium]|nr:response regulator [Actinomycetota bacterium]
MKPKQILVVDDSPLIREVARLGLEAHAGWSVLSVGSGSEALERAAAEEPEAILLDVVMPDMDGPTTLQELRARPATSQIPVIFVTARDGSADRARFQSLDVAGVITKPFQMQGLAGQVAEILGWDA